MRISKLQANYWLIFIICLFSILIRLWRIDTLANFGGDQAYDIERIREITSGNLTLLGPEISKSSTSTLYLGPLYYYLQAPFLLLFNFDPIGMYVPIILSRALTVFLIYLISLKLFGTRPAIFSAIIAGISPYWVNTLGPPSPVYFMLPLVSIVCLLVTNIKSRKRLITKKSVILIATIGFLIGLSTNFHYLGLANLLPVIMFFLFQFKNGRIKAFFTLLAGTIAANLPLLAFELRHKFFLSKQIFDQVNYIAQSPKSSNYFLKINDSLGFISSDSLGVQFSFPLNLIFTICLLAFVYSFFKVNKHKGILGFTLLLSLVNIIFTIFYFGPVHAHYLATAYVAAFMIIGLIFARIWVFNKYLSMAVFILIFILLANRNHFFANQGYTMPEDLTLYEIRKISKIIVQDVNTSSFNIVATLDGDSRAGPYRYLVKIYGKSPQDVEHYDTGDNLYVITRDPAKVLSSSNLFEISSFQPAKVENVWEITANIRLVKLTKNQIKLNERDNFVTVVNPLRGRDLWVNSDITNLTDYIGLFLQKDIPVTWLVQYDNFQDKQVIEALQGAADLQQEVGAFLEVSEKWASDAGVSYKVADGDYYRPDKVFLSGYKIEDRKKLIEVYFEKFQKVFGKSPHAVGAWYIDPYSHKILQELNVKIALTLSDQYDTDAASVWGKYFSFPYYPSKYNSLEPANNESNKISIVNIQWAQRDPVKSYGEGIGNSRHSFQANDYINNGFDFNYFQELISTYLNNQNEDYNQITIGLEIGQEGTIFREEFKKQINYLQKLRLDNRLELVNMDDFALWYQNKYPGISPNNLLQKAGSFWFMSPHLRVAVFKEGDNYVIKDLRYFDQFPTKDYLYQDLDHYLKRQVNATIDSILLKNPFNLGPSKVFDLEEHFDRLVIKLDNREVTVNRDGIYQDGVNLMKSKKMEQSEYQNKLKLITAYNQLTIPAKKGLSILKFSKIENRYYLGLKVGETRLFGFQNLRVGVYDFPTQTISKFVSLDSFFSKWQPWITNK